MADIANLHLRIKPEGIDKAQKALLDLDDAGKKSTQTVKELGKAVAGFLIGTSLTKIVKESTMANARYRELGVTMKAIGMNAGYSSKELINVEDALKKTGISALESRSSIANLIQANIDLSKATDLARLAQDAAVIGGLNSSEAYSRLIYGVQTAQTEVLRTIGITVNFDQAYKKMALQIGKSANALTEQEKIQARVNAVMERGSTISGAYEASMSEAGKQMRSMSRYVDDLKVKMGASFMPEFTDGVSLATKAVKMLEENSTTVATVLKSGLVLGLMSATNWGRKYAQESVKNSYDTIKAKRLDARASLELAKNNESAAIKAHKRAQAEKIAAMNEKNLASYRLSLARGTDHFKKAQNDLELATRRVTQANIEAILVEQNLKSTREQVATTTKKLSMLSTAGAAAKGALNLIGGPAGAAMLAGTALYYFWEQAKAAKEEAIQLGKEVESLSDKMKAIPNFSIGKSSGELVSINESIDKQLNQIRIQENKIEELEKKKRASGLSKALSFTNNDELNEEIKKETANLEYMRDGLVSLYEKIDKSNADLRKISDEYLLNIRTETASSLSKKMIQERKEIEDLNKFLVESNDIVKQLNEKIAYAVSQKGRLKNQEQSNRGIDNSFGIARYEKEIEDSKIKLSSEINRQTQLQDRLNIINDVYLKQQSQLASKTATEIIDLGKKTLAWQNLGSGIAYALGQMQSLMAVDLSSAGSISEKASAELDKLNARIEIAKIKDEALRNLSGIKQDYIDDGFTKSEAENLAKKKKELSDLEEANNKLKKSSSGGVKDDSGVRALMDSKERLRTLTEQLRASEKLTAEDKRLAEFEERILLIKGKAKTVDDLALLAQENLLRSSLQQESYVSRMVNAKQAYLEVSKQITLEQRNQEENLKQQLATLTMSSKQATQYAREQQIRNQFAQKRSEIADSGLLAPAYFASLALQQQSAIGYSKKAYAELTEAESSWKNGAIKAWNDYAENAMNVTANVAQVCSGAFDSVSDALTDMVMSGKADFADMAKSIIADLSGMLVKMAMFSAMKAAIGGTGFGAFLGFASGGYTGSGNKYEPAGVVHKGEFVFTKEATQRLGVRNLYEIMQRAHGGYAQGGVVGGGMVPTINNSNIPAMVGMGTGDIHVSVVVNNNGGNNETKSNVSGGSNDIGKVIGGVVREAIVKESKQGGIIHQVINNRMGR